MAACLGVRYRVQLVRNSSQEVDAALQSIVVVRSLEGVIARRPIRKRVQAKKWGRRLRINLNSIRRQA